MRLTARRRAGDAALPLPPYRALRGVPIDLVSDLDGIGGWAYRLILPSSALSVIFIALIARITRTSVLEVLN